MDSIKTKMTCEKLDQVMKKKNDKESKIPILSFFTGAGFLDIGFIQTGFEIVWCNEYNQSFVKGFEYGMSCLYGSSGEHKITNTSSIVDIGPNQIIKEAFNGSIPEIFGIIGGPPCPDFSVCGKNRGKEGDNGRLSKVYVNRIIELQPTFFLFENVPGLLKTKKHREFLDELINQLLSDYLVDKRILNSLEYGVPQDRERLFVVGFHKKWIKKNLFENVVEKEDWFPWPKNELYVDAKKRFKWPEICPFGSCFEKPPGIPDELMVGSYISNYEEIANLPNGLEGFKPKSQKFLEIQEGDVSGKSFKKLNRGRYSPAVAYGNNEVHLHPTLPRRLTVREAMRLQTVPDEYALPSNMTLSDKFKMIGNGVPIKLAIAIAMSFNELLRGINNGK